MLTASPKNKLRMLKFKGKINKYLKTKKKSKRNNLKLDLKLNQVTNKQKNKSPNQRKNQRRKVKKMILIKLLHPPLRLKRVKV